MRGERRTKHKSGGCYSIRGVLNQSIGALLMGFRQKKDEGM